MNFIAKNVVWKDDRHFSWNQRTFFTHISFVVQKTFYTLFKGAVISSILIAVISRKIVLSQGFL